MAQSYTVAENETLYQIAFAHGFHADSLLQANEDKWPFLHSIAHMLSPGMVLEIPDKENKQVAQSTGTSVVYTVKQAPPVYLSLTLRDAGSEIVSVQLTINGNDAAVNSSRTAPDFFITTVQPLPAGKINSASLKIKWKSMLTGDEQEQVITLQVGGFDAVINPAGDLSTPSSHIATKKAVQKILKNLGYYDAEIDGKLEAQASADAIGRFQHDHLPVADYENEYGIANHKTCVRLMVKSGNAAGIVQPIEKK